MKDLSDKFLPNEALRWIFDNGPEDKAAFDAFLALCSLAKDGVCLASIAELAALMRVSPATAKKCVRRLIDCGRASATRVTSGGRVMKTRYTLDYGGSEQ